MDQSQNGVSATLSWFDRISKMSERIAGQPTAFALALAVIFFWLVSGPFFKFSDTWQLIINTATTIVTFLMVFLIQNTQNRTTAALQLKIDEVIRALHGAHNALVKTDDLSLGEIERLRAQYEDLAIRARAKVQRGRPDIGTPDIPLISKLKNNRH
jgi:low affinity Fe/Cu permease